MSQIEVKNLTFQPGKHSREILKQINQHFVEGEFYGILGPNGSGKTTFIRHILGLLAVQQGRVTIGEKPLKQWSKVELATQLSFVPQNTYMDAAFTVYDIVAMGRTPYRTHFSSLTKEDDERIEEALEITNCTHLEDKLFYHLSGGEAQRVLIARAIAQDTPWMILDEPISHLDIKHQVELMETLKRLNERKNKTIIAILHDLNLTSAYCKQVVLMKNGTVFASGATTRVLTKENLKQVYDLEFIVKQDGSNGVPYFIPVMKKD